MGDVGLEDALLRLELVESLLSLRRRKGAEGSRKVGNSMRGIVLVECRCYCVVIVGRQVGERE